jgi:threonyl-tRNA synthetase
MKKVPFMMVIGEQEEAEGLISVRKHGGESLGKMSVEAFAEMINGQIAESVKPFREV